MLARIKNIVDSSKVNIDSTSGTLFCSNYKMIDKECLLFLEENNCFEEPLYLDDYSDGQEIELELSLQHLATVGFYYSFNFFLSKNKSQLTSKFFYIHDLKCFDSDNNINLTKYRSIICLIDSMKYIAKHSYIDAGVDKSIIVKEDKSIFIHFEYSSTIFTTLDENVVSKINEISKLFKDSTCEKKLLYINELINFLFNITESQRFDFLLSHFFEFYEKGESAYQYYLRDFSYTRLKIELDSKALEYTQKIQSVINESQTKLIAIPTVFVLAFVTFDYTDLLSIKNIATIASLFIFAILIQLFLDNQRSTLNFIHEDIDSYKNTFTNKVETISTRFSMVQEEEKKQRDRFCVVEVILWLIPITLLCLWLFCLGFGYLFYSSIAISIIFFIYKIFIQQ